MDKYVKNHIFYLPRFSNTLIEKLIELGADTICKIPSSFILDKANTGRTAFPLCKDIGANTQSLTQFPINR
jgi:hypothetical protein